jgi:hypothetical protein
MRPFVSHGTPGDAPIISDGIRMPALFSPHDMIKTKFEHMSIKHKLAENTLWP